MQTTQDSGILQTENGEQEKDLYAVAGRQKIRRIPSNHKQAERKLITLVNEGIFEIDEMGRIWRLKKRLGCRWHGTKIIEIPRKRAEHKVPLGYLQIRATIDGKRIHGLAHRLVWQHFFGDIPDGLIMNHKNGIKIDNRPGNLETVTYSENMQHAYTNGLLSDQRGEKNSAAKLSDEQVKIARQMYATKKYTQQEIAECFNVAHQTISKIVKGKRRQNQSGPIDTKDHRHCNSRRDPQTGRFVTNNHK